MGENVILRLSCTYCTQYCESRIVFLAGAGARAGRSHIKMYSINVLILHYISQKNGIIFPFRSRNRNRIKIMRLRNPCCTRTTVCVSIVWNKDFFACLNLYNSTNIISHLPLFLKFKNRKSVCRKI
jgi:hypothetical protein